MTHLQREAAERENEKKRARARAMDTQGKKNIDKRKYQCQQRLYWEGNGIAEASRWAEATESDQ